MKLESTDLPSEITNVFCGGIDCAYRSTQLASKALPRLIVGKKFCHKVHCSTKTNGLAPPRANILRVRETRRVELVSAS
jgi:hypothetical protein